MRICYVITKADEIGGAQVHVRDLADFAQRDGHQVKVIVGERGLFEEQLRDLNIDVKVIYSLQRNINIIKDLKAVGELYAEFKRFQPDLVTLHSSKAGIVGRLAAFLSKKKCIFTAHGWSFADGITGTKKKVYIAIERLFSHLTTKIITVSEQDKKLALKYGVADDSKQIVVHNGIRPIDEKLEKKENDRLKLIMVARFSEQKDHATLLKALSEIRDYKWDLDLIGKGRLEGYYKNMAKELLIDDRVRFLGQRNDVSNLLSSSDIFLLITNWEGYPLSLLEAKRAGLPIIASRVGGNDESVTDSVNGFLVNRADVDGLKSALLRLITDSSLREKFSKTNIAEFSKKHTIEKMYQETLSVYKSCFRS